MATAGVAGGMYTRGGTAFWGRETGGMGEAAGGRTDEGDAVGEGVLQHKESTASVLFL